MDGGAGSVSRMMGCGTGIALSPDTGSAAGSLAAVPALALSMCDVSSAATM